MKLKDYLVEELIPYGHYCRSNEIIGMFHEYSGVTDSGVWVQIRILDSIMQRKTYLMRVIVGGAKYMFNDVDGFDLSLENSVLSAHRSRTRNLADMEV